MGWSTGSRIMAEIIEEVKDLELNYYTEESLYSRLIDIFENWDCDTLDECLGEDAAFDEVYYSKYPEMKEEDEG
jgi:hypothetical protein